MRIDRIGLMGLLGFALAAGSASAQQGDKPGAPQMSAEDKAMMEAFERMGAVGDNHKLLSGMVGEWEATNRMWMKPGQPPMEVTGSASFTSIMGGRYIRQTYKSSMMGQPFDGEGISGYDNAEGHFVSTWMDSMSTGVFLATGKYDPATKSFTYHAEMADPMNPKARLKVRDVLRLVDADNFVFEWYETHDGQEAKTMEITYKRKK